MKLSEEIELIARTLDELAAKTSALVKVAREAGAGDTDLLLKAEVKSLREAAQYFRTWIKRSAEKEEVA